MAELANSVQYVWTLSVGFECIVLAMMLARKRYRNYPAFFFYLVTDTFQAVALFSVYKLWGFNSPLAMYFGWASQGLVICGRALAVAELCRHLLRPFTGIWGLAWRLLVLSAGLVAGYALLTAGWKWNETVLRVNVGLELTMIVVVVFLFLFARYYEVVADHALRTMGIGFFLLSCSKVVNDTILQHRLQEYVNLWRLVGLLVFSASLSLWFWAMFKLAPVPEARPALLPAEIYRSLVPKINERLWDLNERLGQLWRVGAHGS